MGMLRRSGGLCRGLRSVSLPAIGAFALCGPLVAQIGTVGAESKISEMAGGFGGALDPIDYLGWSVAALGDLDGDGINDLAVGAAFDDDGGLDTDPGAVWILFMNADGTVASEQKISQTAGGFGFFLGAADRFGSSLTALGDLDGDGITDLAVGASGTDAGAMDAGAVWILFMNADGTVAAEQKIAESTGGFGGDLDVSDHFGAAISALGDLDGDGITDLAVGAPLDDDGGLNRGAVWILFLNADGTVASEQKISTTSGGFGTGLDDLDDFGVSVASLGDVDADGIGDLAVGAHFDDDGGGSQGAVWILFLDTDGTIASKHKISATAGGFGGDLDPGDSFGRSVGALGDVDGDGTVDVAVGAEMDDDGATNQGAVWILFLKVNGTAASEQKISAAAGGFGGDLDEADEFAFSLSSIGDLDGDGIADLAVGARQDDDGGSDQGAVWILFLEGPDTTDPTLSCPATVVAIDSKSGPPGEFVFFTVTATDDADPEPAVVCVPPSGSFFPRGTTIVTCTATDASGNQAACQFPVIVVPTIHEHPGPGLPPRPFPQ